MKVCKRVGWIALLTSVTLMWTACENDDPQNQGLPDASSTDTAAECALDAVPDPVDGAGDNGATSDTCQALGTDYQFANKDSDGWAACISDGDPSYHLVVPGETPGAAARTAAFDEIRGLVAHVDCKPSGEAFARARDKYSVEQGILSRVLRRPDHHYVSTYPIPAPAGATPDEIEHPCSYPARVQELGKDFCAGPEKLLPILGAKDAMMGAFADGILGNSPRIQGAKIEATLIWFFYLSMYSEMHTGRDTPEDADSMWGYYTGANTADTPAGLASYVKTLDAKTHDRVWDGMRAFRCWRQLVGDSTVVNQMLGTAPNDDKYNLAIAQVDRAALRGVALIVRKRLQKFKASTGIARDAHWAFVQVLGPVLVRQAKVNAADKGALLESEFAKTNASDVDVDGAIAAIDASFGCP